MTFLCCAAVHATLASFCFTVVELLSVLKLRSANLWTMSWTK